MDRRPFTVRLSVLALLAGTRAAAAALPVAFPAGPAGRFGVSLAAGAFAQDRPVVVNVLQADGTEAAVAAAYEAVATVADRAVATATVTTAHGSRFAFTDTWTADRDGAARLARRVAVTAADPRDVGFDTRFGLRVVGVRTVRDLDVFAPGVWYRQNDHVVPHAIGADPALPSYLVKETRLALPMVMARPAAGGPSLTVVHADARPATPRDDRDRRPQVDAGITYASVGPWADDGGGAAGGGVAIGACYPGTEGSVSYGGRGARRRYHPVRAGFAQSYDLLVRARPPAADFPAAMADAWRFAYAAYAPAVRPAPSAAVYRDGLAVFARYYRDDFQGGGRGVPFMVWLDGRGPSDYHLQSGFVGQQTGAAYLMVRDALLAHRPDARWAAALDFWADHSLSPAGVPRTDYFCDRAAWANDPVFLRTVADGAEGVVDADQLTRGHGEHHDNWLAYARRVGDWLLSNQAPDGTWARSYQADGTPAETATFNTTNPLRFLVKLHAATGDVKYLAAAGRAGDWCLAHVDAPSAYVGGTPDNPDTIDKEGGVLAFYGFQALYDATGDRRWLAAAARAADYAETWTYAWSYAVADPRRRRSPWPACGLVGQSLVATGHSYVDMFMAGCSTAYYRLSIQAGDDHYRQFARLLADGANRPADLTGRFGYPDRGGVEEGVESADFVARGPGTCLTWCTVAQVRPVADLRDRFGFDTVDEVEAHLTPADRAARNRRPSAPGR